MCYLNFTMRRPLFTALCVGLSLAIVGCGDPKEKAALDKAKGWKAPGHLRVLNLADVPVNLTDSTRRPMNSNVAPGRAGIMNPCGVGERSFVLEVGGEKIDFKVNIVSDEAHTVVLWPDRKTTVIGGEVRRSKEMNNICVSFIDQNGLMSGQKATVLSGSRKIEVTSETRLYSVTPGEIRSEDGSARAKVEPELAYSLIYVMQNGKLKPYYVLNSDPSKPAGMGAG